MQVRHIHGHIKDEGLGVLGCLSVSNTSEQGIGTSVGLGEGRSVLSMVVTGTVGDNREVEWRRLEGCLGLKGVANRLLD